MAVDISETKVQRNEFGLWFGWTLATALGMLIGHLVLVPLVDNIDLGFSRIIAPILAGLLVGFAQWLVLRGYLANSSTWVLAGGASWAAAFVIGLFVVQSLSSTLWAALLGYALFGLIVGLMQWPILRREIPHVLSWVLANMIGWTLGGYASLLVMNMVFGPHYYSQAMAAAISSGVSGLIAGAVTGLALVMIVRVPEREDYIEGTR